MLVCVVRTPFYWGCARTHTCVIRTELDWIVDDDDSGFVQTLSLVSGLDVQNQDCA